MPLSDTLLSVAPAGPALDVLVVGSGPVGLLAACEIASRGCTVRIIDPNESPVIMTKASGVAERSMEILPAPVAESIEKTAVPVNKFNIFEHDGNGTSTKLGGLVTAGINKRGMKGMRAQMQWMTEKALTDHLVTLPDHLHPGRKVQVERPYHLESFKEVADGVECEIKHAKTGSIERVTAKFLLGCDGGRSSIRKGLKFTFDGETTPEYFFAIHAQFTGYVGGENSTANLFFSKGDDPMAPGWGFSMPLPKNSHLCIVDLDLEQQKKWVTGELDRNGLPVLRQPTQEDVVELLRVRGAGKNMCVVPGTVEWLTHFRVNSRQTNHYGKGRIFLAGDACHCHSPLGGQGMNMGFNDAKNIAWKLAFAAKGTIPSSTLDTYEKERYLIEHKILLAIEKAQKAVSSRDPTMFFVRGRLQRIAPTLINFAVEHSGDHEVKFVQFGTQQAWSYATSPLSSEHWERPRPQFPNPFPSINARKNQNLHRWIGNRLHAGESVPDAKIGNTTVHAVLKRSRGFTLLLFEGSADDNAVLQKYGKDVKILNVGELQSLGDSLKTPADSAGYVGGIDEVLVVPADSEAQQVFHVRAQCLYLVRPDMHVGLRSEPLRKDAVLQYFDKNMGMKVSKYNALASSPSLDMLPITIHLIFFCLIFSICAANGFEKRWLNALLGLSICVLTFLTRASRPPSD